MGTALGTVNGLLSCGLQSMGCGACSLAEDKFSARFSLAGDAVAQPRGDGDIICLTASEEAQCGMATYLKPFDNQGVVEIRAKVGIYNGTGGDGLCMALVDTSNAAHMELGSSNGLGFVGRSGAVLGVGLDVSGGLGAGEGVIAVKAGEWRDFETIEVVRDCELSDHLQELCLKIETQTPVPRLSLWHNSKLILNQITLEGLVLPPSMKVCFMGSTSTLTNRHTLLDLAVKEEIDLYGYNGNTAAIAEKPAAKEEEPAAEQTVVEAADTPMTEPEPFST